MTLTRIRLLAGVALLTSGCTIGGMVGAAVDSVEAAPEPAAGPRPKVVVAAFKVAAPKAREEVGDGLRQAGIAALGLGADRVEVHEPRLEERPRHRLQRLVDPPVQLDLVVQRAEDVGDGALFHNWR